MSLRHQAFSLAWLGRYAEAIDVAKRSADCAAQIGDKSEEAASLLLRAFSLGRLGRHEEAVEIAKRAPQIGDKREQAGLLQLQAYSLYRIGRHNQAWESLIPALALRHIDDAQFALAVQKGVLIASHVPRREIATLYAEWIEVWRQAGPTSKLPHPASWVSKVFAAAARAGGFSELDAMLRNEGDWLANQASWVWFSDAGSVIARVAGAEGRARAYETAAGLLPRIKSFVVKLRRLKQDHEWLTDIIVCFAGACHDPGLLRDVATLLTEDLTPNAPEIGRWLRALADVDEVDDSERILARMDPDMATLIRRLRDLPDPPPLKPKRAKGRSGKPI
jgi:tetratricopeptide (TPR) repeat protein